MLGFLMQECGLPKQRRLPGWVKAEKEEKDEKEALDKQEEKQEKKHQKRSNCETKPN